MAFGYYEDFAPYVSVAERRAKAARKLDSLRKKGVSPNPIVIDGRAIAKTFWGKAWCDHLDSHADLANRLGRGRTYVRNGSVIDLNIAKGEVTALVSGSDIYEVRIRIGPLAAKRFKAVCRECAGQIGTLVELLAGKFSDAVMEVLCNRTTGLFPKTADLEMSCSCPDGAWLCKHLAAVLYGVGARLDHEPELLFTLRGVDGAELVAAAARPVSILVSGTKTGSIGEEQLADIFGIEMETTAPGRRATVTSEKRNRLRSPTPSKPAPRGIPPPRPTRAKRAPVARPKRKR